MSVFDFKPDGSTLDQMPDDCYSWPVYSALQMTTSEIEQELSKFTCNLNRVLVKIPEYTRINNVTTDFSLPPNVFNNIGEIIRSLHFRINAIHSIRCQQLVWSTTTQLMKTLPDCRPGNPEMFSDAEDLLYGFKDDLDAIHKIFDHEYHLVVDKIQIRLQKLLGELFTTFDIMTKQEGLHNVPETILEDLRTYARRNALEHMYSYVFQRSYI